MLKFFKLIIGLCLLPLCRAFSCVLYALFVSVSSDPSAGGAAWPLPAGFLISVLGFFLLPRPFRTYVLAHEMTHAFWGLLAGARVGRMKVGREGGHVELSKSNFLISLAPYFFPFYTGLVIAGWYAAGFFYDLSAYTPWWMALIGLTWGFHVTFTVYMLSRHQPDIQEHGRLFSYVIIYLANLFFVALWMILIGAPTFVETGGLLRVETAVLCKALWNQALEAGSWISLQTGSR